MPAGVFLCAGVLGWTRLRCRLRRRGYMRGQDARDTCVLFFGDGLLEFVEGGESLAEFFDAVFAEGLEDPVTGGDA